ncbi:MAG: PKD domain-containing protein [Thermoplasmata archaeon]|nr:PKD domain-containing protein [Thermoplasmata archaeon]
MNKYNALLLALALLTVTFTYPSGYDGSSPMANQAPVADAGPDQTIILGDTVTLDGSGSYDPDGLINIEANIRVNDASGSQWQTPPSIGVDSTGEIHVLWEDYRTGEYDIYSSHMASNGTSFAANVKVNDDVNPNRQSRPEMATGPGDLVHAVWEDYRNNNWDIYYANSTDGGLSFGTNVRVTNEAAGDWQNNPSLAVDAFGTVHVVWEDDRNSNWSIFYANSLDGFSSNTDVSWGSTPGNQWGAIVEVGDSGTIHVVWEAASDIRYSRSSDGGLSFGTSLVLNDDGGNASQGKPSIAVESGGIVHVAWEDARLGDSDIFYTRSADNGATFDLNVRINDDATTESQATPAVAVEDGEFVHIAWADARLGGWDIFYTASGNGGANFLPNVKVNDDTLKKYWQTRPTITSEDGGSFHVAWKDSRLKSSGLLYDVFYAEGKVTRLSYNWDFGDGSPPSSEVIVNHIYSSSGNYTARLTVTDEQGGSGNDTAVITVEKEQVPITVEIDIDPDTLNLKSKGKWITVYVEISGADPRDIVADSVLLNDTLSPENDTKYGFVTNESSFIKDNDGDGIEERMFKFDRSAVQAMVSPAENVTLVVTFKMTDGSEHSGSDTIRVIDPPKDRNP